MHSDLRIRPEGRSVLTYETTSVEVFMDQATRSARLSNLYSINRGKGYASILLGQICAWADKNDIHLWLVARPYGSPRNALDGKNLVAFYERFGFEIRRDGPRNEMHRDPAGR